MLPRFALLLVLLVIGLLTFAWLQADTPPAPASAAQNAVAAAANSPSRAAPQQGQDPADEIDRIAANATIVTTQRAIDADAIWVELTIVHADGTPIPGAKVSWYDELASDLLQAKSDLFEFERNQIYRQPMLFAEQFGWSTLSDADGKAKVTVRASTWVAARHSDQFGRLQLDAGMHAPSGGHRLVLSPDATMRALVLDVQKQPVAGVWLTLAVTDPEGSDLGTFISQPMNRTDRHGIAEFPHFQQWRRILIDDVNLEQRSPRASVRIFFSHSDDAGAIIDLEAAPIEPIVLHMQATGMVRAKVEIPGQAIASGHELVLTCDDSRFDDYMVARLQDDGWAHFQHVPIGKSYRLHSLAARGIQQQFKGPGQMGATVDVVLRPATTAIMLRARFIDELGQVVAKQQLNANMEGESLPRWLQLETDDLGQCLALLASNEDGQSLQLQSGIITPLYQSMRLGTANLPARLLHPGINDLGDVVLRRGEVIASGALFAGDKPYRGKVYVGLQRHHEPSDNDLDGWQNYSKAVTAFADVEGHFEVCGELDDGQYRVTFHGPELQPVAPVPLLIGNTNMRVQVTPGHGIIATFLLPEGSDPSQLVYRLRPTDARAVSAPLQEMLDEAYPERREGERCMIDWSGLPPGDYTLEVSFWNDAEVLVSIPSISVPLSPSGDARLADIDLRNFVQVVTIRAIDTENQPLDCYGALFPAPEVAAGTWRGSAFGGPATRLLLPKGALDLVLAAEGFQRAVVRGNGPTFDVILHEWPMVQIRVVDIPQLPDGITLHAELQAAQPWLGQWHGHNYEDSLQSLLGVSYSHEAVINGIVALPIGDGGHHLSLTLTDGDRTVPVIGVTPRSILVTTDTVEARAPATSWEAAIAQFRK